RTSAGGRRSGFASAIIAVGQSHGLRQESDLSDTRGSDTGPVRRGVAAEGADVRSGFRIAASSHSGDLRQLRSHPAREAVARRHGATLGLQVSLSGTRTILHGCRRGTTGARRTSTGLSGGGRGALH